MSKDNKGGLWKRRPEPSASACFSLFLTAWLPRKQERKDENEKLVEQLDKDFESLVQSQALSTLGQPNKMKALKFLVNPNFSQELKKKAVTSISENSKQEEPNSYDKLVSEMVFEMHTHPFDRTKTPEETAEEEKERLEQLEHERQNRMLATDDVSNEGNDSDSANNEGEDKDMWAHPSARPRRYIS
ncbi:hypothetical protein Cgig2_000958 [Carnegiea gigantea]|uniref:Uncharacterized protein n=1 Tax=Carnegiea gigantea TaxID=171969 RepID=A0A9Q1KLU2_9CARY|nr:hypothetical protein Cgig2_000958 [Carnegiea gigantea]